MTENKVEDRSGPLETLRGLAILLVLMRHAARQISIDTPWLLNGWIGVDLFYVLSGHLILSSLLARGSRGYYLSRGLRLLPAYYTVLALYVVHALPPATGSVQSLAWPDWLSHLFLMTDYADSSLSPVFWSLGVECKFYLLAPFAAAAILEWPSFGLRVIALSLAVPVLFRLVELVALGSPLGYSTFFGWFRSPFPASCDGLVVGMLIACARWYRLVVPVFVARWAFWASLAAAILVLRSPSVIEPQGAFAALWLQCGIGFMWGGVVWGATADSVIAAALTRLAIIRWIGRISYSLYLLHFPLAMALRQVAVRFVGAGALRTPFGAAMFVVALLSSSCAVSTVFYLVVERPSLGWSRRARGSRPSLNGRGDVP